MKRAVILTILSLFILGAQAHADDQLRRFALVIGANNGGAELVRLRYAVQDAQSVVKVMKDLGGVKPEDCTLLVDPNVSQLVSAFNAMRSRIATANSSFSRTEVFVYYSGHSDEQGLRLASERLSYTDLRNLIDSLPADVRIGILDSCSSGMMTRLKGGTAVAPFMLDTSASMEGYAYLTSSSYDEASQESDAIGGSFFTHYLVSGLRGAADANADSKVTLNELYQFTFDETLNRTQQTIGGPQHPGYDIEMSGAGDVVMTDVRQTTAFLVLSEDLNGRIFVRNADNKLVAELNKLPQRAVTIGLEPGTYSVLLQQNNNQLRQGQFRVPTGGQVEVSLAKLTPVASENATARGGTFITTTTTTSVTTSTSTGGTGTASTTTTTVPAATNGTPSGTHNTNFSLFESFASLGDTNYVYRPLDISLWPGMDLGLPICNPADRKVINTISLNVIGNSSTKLIGFAWGGIFHNVTESMFGYQTGSVFASVGGNAVGAQMAGVFTTVGGNMLGGQGAGVFCTVGGNLIGGQGAGMFVTVGGNLTGAQGAGLFAIVKGNLVGVEGAGIFTVAEGHVKGFQAAGVWNSAHNNMLGIQAAGVANFLKGDLIGIQVAGLLNSAAGYVNGAQVGTINTANVIQGGQIGLINTARTVNGIQIGLINIAKEMNGIPIGLISICRDGYNNISFWRDESQFMTLAMTWGSKYIYSTFGMGVNQAGDRMSLTAGMGMHFPVSKLFFDVEGLWDNIFPLDQPIEMSAVWKGFDFATYDLFQGNVQNLVHVRLKAGFQITKWLAVMGGVSYTVYIPRNNTWDPVLAPANIPVADWVSEGYKSWPGFFIGIQLL